MKFLFKYATYKRPDWFKQTLEIYYSMLSGQHHYEFVISLNANDKTMNNPEMRVFMDGKPGLSYCCGLHKTKIEAINADMKGLDFDILFLISDDMIPIVPDFDIIIAEKMKEHFSDLEGALHFNDGCCGRDKCITLSIMGKKLYDYFGYIYHPAYKSFFCDEEFTNVVYQLGKVKYFPQVIVRHDWKGWGEGRDEVYARNTKLGKDDKRIFIRRKKLGFSK